MVLSPQEVAAILQAVTNLKHRTVLTVIYAGGLRLKEAVSLKPEHIDADQMQIRVVQGKGQKDRYTLLGEKALDLLRLYWRVYRPTNFLFYGRDKNAAVSTSTVGKVFRRALANSGVKKQASVHTLRHSFATHLLQDNVDLVYIQRLLGHRSASSTRIYLHVARGDIARLKSPVDRLPEDNMAPLP